MNKIVVHEYWYDHTKPKYGDKTALYYGDTDSIIVHVKSEYMYADIAEGVEKR